MFDNILTKQNLFKLIKSKRFTMLSNQINENP